jgi:hypothetical protein
MTTATLTAAIEHCADEGGGAILVTITNPSGSASFDLVVYENIGYTEGSEFWSYRSTVNVEAGEQVAVLVDEVALRTPDGGIAPAGPVKGLAAAGYRVVLGSVGWATDTVITVPACSSNPVTDNLPSTL